MLTESLKKKLNLFIG